MNRLIVSFVALFIAILMISTSSVAKYVNSKSIMDTIECPEKESFEEDTSYIKEFIDPVSRIRELVFDGYIPDFKPIIAEKHLEKELEEKNIWEKSPIKLSIRNFEQRTFQIRELLENNAERNEIIHEFRELISSVNKFLDKNITQLTSFDKFITRIIGLLMMLIGLLMIFLSPIGITAGALIFFIEGLIRGDIARGLNNALYYVVYIYFPFALVVIFLGSHMFKTGVIPYLPP